MEEQTQNCVYCENSLPHKGFYCPNCAKQVRCKECKESLEKNARACIYCGTTVGAQGQLSGEGIDQTISGGKPVMNEIEYHETRSSRSARAKFTDTVGNSVSNALVGFIGKGFKTNPTPPKFEKGPLIEDTSAEIVDETNEDGKEDTTQAQIPLLNEEKLQPQGDLALIQKVFRFEAEKTILSETRLKAQNKIDYVRRLILLFLYGNYLLGKSNVPRNEVTKLIEKANLNYPAARSWIANNGSTSADHEENTLEINTPGIELAKQYLQEISDPEVKDIWLITTAPKKRKKRKQETDNSEE